MPRTVERLLEIGQVDTTDSAACWIWHMINGEASTTYGRLEEGRTHRVMYQATTGETLERADVVMHTCDNPPCVNPAHLRRGTQSENARDMLMKGRQRPPFTRNPDGIPVKIAKIRHYCDGHWCAACNTLYCGYPFRAHGRRTCSHTCETDAQRQGAKRRWLMRAERTP